MEYLEHEFVVVAYLREYDLLRLPFDIFFAESEVDIERVVTFIVAFSNNKYTHYQVFKVYNSK